MDKKIICIEIGDNFVKNLWKIFWFVAWLLFIICLFQSCYLNDKYVYKAKNMELEYKYKMLEKMYKEE